MQIRGSYLAVFAICEVELLHPIILIYFTYRSCSQLSAQHSLTSHLLNLIIKYFFSDMFSQHSKHSKLIQTSIFPHRNHPSLIKPGEGYHNIESPLKAALRLETSPLHNLSPLRHQNQTESKLNNKRSHSPILFSKRDTISPNSNGISPLRKRQALQPQQNYGLQQHISFRNIVRRNSNVGNYQYQNPSRFNQTMECSNQNYLKSDRNFREDTNLFKKLANMIKSNKSNESSFVNSAISDNSVQFRAMPQSCRNQHNSNKKMFINNVMTVQSIQSPEQKEYSFYNDNFDNVQAKSYQEYQKMTLECGNRERKSSFDGFNGGSDPKMEKKESRKALKQGSEFQALSFKEITFCNEKAPLNQSKNINYHLTNSFGKATRDIKNQIIGEASLPKPAIKPFEQINNDHPQPLLIESINRSVNESQDSIFASLKMLLSKVNANNVVERVEEHESINVSIASDSEASQLDMEPFLKKRK